MLSWVRKWRRNDDGVTAIEFAMVAMPMFMLLMGTIEMGFFFATSSVLEGAANSAARMVRTGQVQTSADPETTFKDQLCDQADAIISDCNELQYEVIRVDPNTFAGADTYEPEFDSNGDLIPAGFSTGNSNDVVLIRVVRRHEFLTPFIGKILSNNAEDNKITQMTTVVLKAEPYNFGEE